jgi:hypothetical protein
VLLGRLFAIVARGLTRRIDRDLALGAGAAGWTGGFDPARWRHGQDPNQRSEWIRESGQAVFVFAYALGPFQSFARREAALRRAPLDLVGTIDAFSIAGRSGLRAVDRRPWNGAPAARLRFFVFDAERRETHLVEAFSGPDESAIARTDRDLREFLSLAHWVAPQGP